MKAKAVVNRREGSVTHLFKGHVVGQWKPYSVLDRANVTYGFKYLASYLASKLVL